MMGNDGRGAKADDNETATKGKKAVWWWWVVFFSSMNVVHSSSQRRPFFSFFLIRSITNAGAYVVRVGNWDTQYFRLSW